MNPRISTALVSALIVSGCLSFFQGPTYGNPEEERSLSHTTTLLRDSSFRNLTVEIDYVDGYKPSALALEALETTIRSAVRKDSIQVWSPSLIPRQDAPYSDQALARIHNATFDAGRTDRPYGENGNATLHIVYLNGLHASRFAAGMYRPMGTIFVFLDAFDGNLGHLSLRGSGLNPFRDRYDRATLVHELGHAFGLVNCGLPMTVPRENKDHPCHSTNSGSVMYPTLHDSRPFPWQVVPDPIWQYDADDWEDIRSYRDS